MRFQDGSLGKGLSTIRCFSVKFVLSVCCELINAGLRLGLWWQEAKSTKCIISNINFIHANRSHVLDLVRLIVPGRGYRTTKVLFYPS